MTNDILNQKKADLIWNTAGSLIYALSSMVMAFSAMRLFGPKEGGVFGFGFSTLGQHIFIISYFGMRPFHITDSRPEYSFGEYRRSRELTAFSALFAAAAYLCLFSLRGAYTPYKAVSVFLLCAYKAVDGYADLYESEAQRDGKLYIGGRALFFRTLLSMCAFLLCGAISGSLILSAAAGMAFQLLGLWLFNIRGFYRGFSDGGYDTKLRPERIYRLLKAAFPLFVSTFLDFYIFSSAKYAIDWLLSDGSSGIFNILFMPTNVIYLMANFIIKPFMTELSRAYELRERDRFLLYVRRIALVIAGITAFCVFMSLVLGGPVLRLLELILGGSYKGELSSQLPAFVIIILGGGIYAMNNLCYYLLVILRRQLMIFGIYAIGTVLALGISMLLVGSLGILGGAISYLVLMLLMLLMFAALSAGQIKRGFDRSDE